MRLTICTSQRPRQNINIYSHPNLRGLRTGKPTTSCLCFCFKLNRVRTGQTKDFTSRKSRAKAPHFVHLLHTRHLTVTNICLVWQLNAAYTRHMLCWSRGLASLEIVEISSHSLNYRDKYRFLFNRPFPLRRWPDCSRYLVPRLCLIHTSLEDTKTWSNFISHQGDSQLVRIVIGTAWNTENAPDGIPRP